MVSFYKKDMLEVLIGHQISDEKYFGILERFVLDKDIETKRFFEKEDLELMMGRQISDIEYIGIFEDFIVSQDDLYKFVREYPFNSRLENQSENRR